MPRSATALAWVAAIILGVIVVDKIFDLSDKIVNVLPGRRVA